MQTLTGVVFTGNGEAREFTQLAWLRDYFRVTFGFDPYPGTLNIRLDDAAVAGMVRSGPAYDIKPGGADYCAAKAIRVAIGGKVPAVWIIPLVSDYPADHMELMAPNSLRNQLEIKDGDAISVQILDGVA